MSKLFKRFFNVSRENDTSTKSIASTTASSSGRSRSSRGSRSTGGASKKKMTGRKLSTKTSITEEVPEIVCETQPTNVQVIEEMLKVWQNCTAEDQFLPFYVSPRAKHILEDGFSKDAREFANIMIDIKKSFPDFKSASNCQIQS